MEAERRAGKGELGGGGGREGGSGCDRAIHLRSPTIDRLRAVPILALVEQLLQLVRVLVRGGNLERRQVGLCHLGHCERAGHGRHVLERAPLLRCLHPLGGLARRLALARHGRWGPTDRGARNPRERPRTDPSVRGRFGPRTAFRARKSAVRGKKGVRAFASNDFAHRLPPHGGLRAGKLRARVYQPRPQEICRVSGSVGRLTLTCITAYTQTTTPLITVM